MNKRKQKWIAALVIMLAVTVAGCNGTKNKEEATQNTESAKKWAKIEKAGTLKVATPGTLYPTSFHDKKTNELTGYVVDTMNEVGKRLNLKVEYSEIGADGMFAAVNNGQVDITASDVEITKSREKKFDFSEPIKYSFGSMIVRKSDQSGIHSLKDLKGKKSAGAATTVYMDISKKYGAEPVIYDNVTNDQYLSDVANGRTDVILNDYYLQKMTVEAMPEIPVMIPEIYYKPTSIGLVMKKDDTELKAKVDEQLSAMQKDGTLTKLSEKYFGGADVSKKTDVKITEEIKVD